MSLLCCACHPPDDDPEVSEDLSPTLALAECPRFLCGNSLAAHLQLCACDAHYSWAKTTMQLTHTALWPRLTQRLPSNWCSDPDVEMVCEHYEAEPIYYTQADYAQQYARAIANLVCHGNSMTVHPGVFMVPQFDEANCTLHRSEMVHLYCAQARLDDGKDTGDYHHRWFCSCPAGDETLKLTFAELAEQKGATGCSVWRGTRSAEDLEAKYNESSCAHTRMIDQLCKLVPAGTLPVANCVTELSSIPTFVPWEGDAGDLGVDDRRRKWFSVAGAASKGDITVTGQPHAPTGVGEVDDHRGPDVNGPEEQNDVDPEDTLNVGHGGHHNTTEDEEKIEKIDHAGPTRGSVFFDATQNRFRCVSDLCVFRARGNSSGHCVHVRLAQRLYSDSCYSNALIDDRAKMAASIEYTHVGAHRCFDSPPVDQAEITARCSSSRWVESPPRLDPPPIPTCTCGATGDDSLCSCGSKCSCGAAWAEELVEDGQCTLYDTSRAYIGCETYKRVCSSGDCSSCQVWDGAREAYLRVGPSTSTNSPILAFSHRLCQEYVHSAVVLQHPTHDFYSQIVDRYRGTCSGGGRQEFPSLTTFRSVAWAVLRASESMESLVQSFTCTVCGTLAECPVLVCDGTATALQRAKAAPSAAPAPTGTCRHGSNFKDRTLLPHTGLRSMIRAFDHTAGQPGGVDDEMDAPRVALIAATRVHASFLLEPVRAMCGYMEGTDIGSPERWQRLLRSIVQPTPVYNGLIKNPAEVAVQLTAMVTDGAYTPDARRVMFRNFPDLYDFLQGLPEGGAYLTLITPLLRRLSQLCSLEHIIGRAHVEELADDLSDVWCPTTRSDDFNMGWGCPTVTEIRPHNKYAAGIRDDSLGADGLVHAEICRKNTRKHPSLLPGIFTFVCVHGVCLGFQLMKQVESPETVFTALFTRLRRAPPIVIYDNACKLHVYTIKREPYHFRDTQFFIDRFHTYNHVGCSAGYDMRKFARLAPLCSQGAEQYNNELKDIR